MQMINNSIKAILFSIFGSLKWNLPPWLSWIFSSIKRFGAGIKNQHTNKRGRFYLIVFILLLAFAGLLYGYFWYANLPQPVRLSVSTNYLEPTPLREDAEPEVFIIEFGGSAAQIESMDKVVSEGIEVVPPINGEWKWDSDDKLVFTVEGDWPVGVNAKVKLNKILFPKHVHLEKYEVNLDTPEFRANIDNISFYQDPSKENEKKVVAEVHFTHPIDIESFEDHVEFTFVIGGKEEGRIIKR